MKTMVRESSLETYAAIRSEGGLTRMQSLIMGVIREGRDYSLQELVAISGLPINTVSGRVNELKTANRLQHGPDRKCSITGRTVHPVRLPSKQFSLL